ncbi:MAG TPA: aminotransferase class IV [bacterium]|nr:aminotransferase class IV [bacterium]HPP29963.1 aminotransferase class IV [bacterium]
MKTIYILDGKKIKERDITFSHLKRGFLYGDGIFETLRAKDNRIFMWTEHIKRLKKGAGVCGLGITEKIEDIKEDIERHIEKENIRDAYIRINIWREKPDFFDPGQEKKTHILVIIRRYHPYPENFYREGVRCIVSKKYFKNEKSPIVYIKSLNYLENILARMEAKKNYCDDAVLLNTSGYIASGTVSNFFFVKKDVIYTPSIDCGILPGTTRGLVIGICKKNRIKLKEGRFTLKDLKGAEEVFLTNTLMGVLPVREIKGTFKGKDFSISRFLMEEIDRKIKG